MDNSNKIFLLDGYDMGAQPRQSTDNTALLMSMMQNKGIDPNVLAMMKNNDGFGDNGMWWIFILLLFGFWGGNGFGGFGGNNGAGIPNQINNDANTGLLMQALNGNKDAINQLATTFNCTTGRIEQAICALQGGIDKVAGDVKFTSAQVINAIQAGNCQLGAQLASCCCDLQATLSTQFCNVQNAITQQGFQNQLATVNQTNTLQNQMNSNFNAQQQSDANRFNILSAKIDAQTQLINQQFCDLEKRSMQDKINTLTAEKQTLESFAAQQAQTANIVSQLRAPAPVPAYIVGNPNCCYQPTVQVASPACACATATGAVV